jgi:hypothetical protein
LAKNIYALTDVHGLPLELGDCPVAARRLGICACWPTKHTTLVGCAVKSKPLVPHSTSADGPSSL